MLSPWRIGVKRMYELTNEKTMVAVKAFEAMGRATDYMPDRRTAASSAAVPADGVAVLLSGGAVTEIMRRLNRDTTAVTESMEHHELESDV